MIKHIFKLIWKRKRANFFLILEIFASFIVLFAVGTLGCYYYYNYTSPVGFEYENVWRISTAGIDQLITGTDSTFNKTYFNMSNVLDEFDEISHISLQNPVPYDMSQHTENYEYNGTEVQIRVSNVYQNLDKVLNINISQGRWFNAGDDVDKSEPVILNQLAVEKFAFEDNPIGKVLIQRTRSGTIYEHRIVGVVDHFKLGGEFSHEIPLVFLYKNLNSSEIPLNFMVKVKPGTDAEVEALVQKRLQTVAKDRTITIKRLENLRKSSFKFEYSVFISAIFISGSLMLMVGLGLLGVLWLNVSKRTKEIGLRRAKGANRMHIYKQIIGELIVVTTFGVFIGFLFALQFPLMNFVSFLTLKTYLLAIFFSIVVIYSLTYICALYPGRIAVQINPAEALHTE